MKLGGYNPQAAVTFGEKMATTGGQKLPDILNTQPSDDRQISDIKAFGYLIERS